VRLGCDDRGRESHLAERGRGLRSARDDRDAVQRVGECRLRVAGGEQARELARADASQQDDGVEFAGEEALGELECLGVIRERYLPHRRCDEGRAALPRDQLADLRRAPALQREHPPPIERHIGIIDNLTVEASRCEPSYITLDSYRLLTWY